MKTLKKDKGLVNAAVVFSSGFFGFFSHAGVLSAIRELGLKPSAYGGSSSGAIVAAMAASGMSGKDIENILFGLKKKDFWDPDPLSYIMKKTLCFLKGYSGFLNGDGFYRLLQRIPVKRIEECKIPLAIAATNLTQKREEIFLRGNLMKAVHASGAVPLMFKPVAIGDSLYADGGVVEKAPVLAVSELTDTRKIIVHMISSRGVEDMDNSFLKRRLTPWHLHHLAYNIARVEAYNRELEIVKMLGFEVVEIRTKPLSLGPNKLNLGPDAYKAAKISAARFLKEYIES
jgi:NTE family protein